MPLFSRYICAAFIRFFFLGLSMCAALFFLVELFDRIDNFIEREADWQDVFLYLAMRLLAILYFIIPVACLLASVLTFSTLNKHNEIVAMRAAGISPLRLARALFGLGLVACVGLLLVQEYVMPYANRTASQIYRTRLQRQKVDVRLGAFQSGAIWYRTDNRIWSVQRSEPLANRFEGVTIYVMRESGRIEHRYDAARAKWGEQGWIVYEGSQRRFDEQGYFVGESMEFTELQLSFPERPTEISALKKESNEMSIRESWELARRMRRLGLCDARYMVEFHGKVAFAATCIVMAGFGAPLALLSNRSGGAARALALTLVCGLSYWILHSIAIAFGQSGYLPPVVAAWLGNVCFGTGSVYLAARLH